MTLQSNLLRLLDAGRDSALLRFSLGETYLRDDDPAQALTHLRCAVQLDPFYSAAWAQLGRAWLACGNPTEAAKAWTQGVAVAEPRGDLQALRQMKVWLRRHATSGVAHA